MKVVLLVVTSIISCSVSSAQATCGYESCDLGKPGMINVHVVPHTHDDVGWLETVDQYYVDQVQYILDSVMMALEANPNRKFSYVESAFFYRWWAQQNDIMRHKVKGFVNNGQLSFILGGWCMNDEAATHYNAIIDQHTRGVQFLKTNFGECGRPRVAWQIDPFGHSKEQASLFAQMSYDAVYFARIDYQDYHRRNMSRELEMIWRGSDDISADLFTGALFNQVYGPPKGMNFDIYAQSNIQDDKRLHDYNVDEVVNQALEDAISQNQSFRGNHILWLMGDDFNYQNAQTWYKNLDKLISLVNSRNVSIRGGHIMWTEGMDFNYQNAQTWFKNLDKLLRYTNARQANGSKVNLLYSTPSCYTYAKNKAGVTWPEKKDDFFPYAHREHAYWSGYFTSRSSLKGMVRDTNNFLQVVKQLDTLAALGPEHSSDFILDILKRAMAVAQHHDAVSGTAKQVVTYDYAERLADGVNQCMEVVNHAYQKLMSPPSSKFQLPLQEFCPLVNISMCNATETSKYFGIVVYNPLGRESNSFVRLPVTSDAFNVTDSQGNNIPVQFTKVSKRTEKIPERNGSIGVYDMWFRAKVPAVGYNTYFAIPTKSYRSPTSKHVKQNAGKDYVISNKILEVTFDGTSGLLKQINNKASDVKTKISQQLMFYTGFKGNNSGAQFTASGAYIFRPNEANPIPLNKTATITVYQGKLFSEVRQTFSDWGTQVFRLAAGDNHLEIEWTVGPIPSKDMIGREVVSRFSSDLMSQGVFYTDANGRQMLTRSVNYRKTWHLDVNEPVAGNYYPVNSRIYIQDLRKSSQLTVLTDRSQGGSSISNGSLELMLHRITMCDDALGVNEPLHEKGSDGRGLIVRGKQYLIFDTITNSAKLHRDLAERMFMSPLVTVSRADVPTINKWKKLLTPQKSYVSAALPDNVHLLTLESLDKNKMLLRLEHFYSKSEDKTLSKNVTVSIQDMFSSFKVTDVTEMTLEANQELADATRLNWNGKSFNTKPKPIGDRFSVELSPMMIRTFEVTYQ